MIISLSSHLELKRKILLYTPEAHSKIMISDQSGQSLYPLAVFLVFEARNGPWIS